MVNIKSTLTLPDTTNSFESETVYTTKLITGIACHNNFEISAMALCKQQAYQSGSIGLANKAEYGLAIGKTGPTFKKYRQATNSSQSFTRVSSSGTQRLVDL